MFDAITRRTLKEVCDACDSIETWSGRVVSILPMNDVFYIIYSCPTGISPGELREMRMSLGIQFIVPTATQGGRSEEKDT